MAYNSNMLLAYQATQIMCSKCGAMVNTRKYCKGMAPPTMESHPWPYMLGQIHGCTQAGEHLHLICEKCGYHSLMHTYEHAQQLKSMDKLLNLIQKGWPDGQQEEP